MNRRRPLNVAVLVGVAFGCSACNHKNAKDAVSLPDISAVYRADKELNTAFSMKRRPADFADLFVRFKTETSILRDQVSYDARLAAFVPLVDKYDRIVRLYELDEQIKKLFYRYVDCIERHGGVLAARKTCDPPYDAERRTLAQGIRSGDIACDPVSGKEACDLPARIAAMETEATNAYMSLPHSQQRPQ